MSRSNNRLTQKGFVAADPEAVVNPNTNQPIGVNVVLYVDDSYRDRKTEEIVERSYPFKYVFYGERNIERVNRLIKKGQMIEIEGKLTRRKWESATRKNEDGTPATDVAIDLVGDSFTILRYKDKTDEQAAAAAGSAASTQDYDDDSPF